MEKKTITAIFSDLHAGSRTAIFPRSWTIDDMIHKPGLPQRKIYDWWVKCWQRVAEVRKGRRLVIIGLGDYTEGVHHGTTEIITNNIMEQERTAAHLIDEAMQIAEFGNDDTLYMVGGSQAHDGIANRYGERIAADLGAKPHKGAKNAREARFIWPRLLGKIDGVLFDCLHQGFTVGGRVWTKTNSMASILQHVYLSRLEDGQEIPMVMVSAHVHRYAHKRHEGKRGRIDGYVCPSWQLKTSYGYRAAKYDTLADIGMLIFEGAECEPQIMEFEQDKVKVL